MPTHIYAAIGATEATAQEVISSASSEYLRSNVQVYVDATSGDDGNPGTSGSPVKTLIRALEILPVAWAGKCRIHLAAGTYDMPLRWATGSPIAGGQRLLVEGHMSVIVPGTITGVAFDARNCLVITDNTLVMTPNAHRLMYVEFLTGTHAGWRYPITANTPTDLTLLKGNTNPLPPSPGDLFQVVVPDAVIQTLALAHGMTYTGVIAAFKDCDISMDPSSLNYEQDCSMMFDTCRFTNPSLVLLRTRTLNVTNGEAYFGPLNAGMRHEFDDFPQSISDDYANGVIFQAAVASVGNAGSMTGTSMVHEGGNISGSFTAQWGGAMTFHGVDVNSTVGLALDADGGYVTLGGASGQPISKIRTPSQNSLQVANGGRGSFSNIQTTSIHINGNGVLVDGVGSRAALVGVTTPSPIARYGIVVSNGAYCNVDATTTANGVLGNFIVDSIPGSWANNRVNGVFSNLVSRLDGGSPVLFSAGPYVNGNTANYMSFVVRVAVGANAATVSSNLVRAASALRGTIMRGQPGIAIQSVAPGAGSVTVTLSAMAMVTPVDVLIENIGN